jgi:predicted component of type VI protein secretion system
MAYLILSTDGHEWDRRELTGPIVLGRSPECDIPVHDILLSRRHCRLTPSSDGWLLIDLASRNGTCIGDQTVEQCRLKHGDVIRVGKTTLRFCTDVLVKPEPIGIRPEFPPAVSKEDTLAGTVVGMTVPLPPATESVPRKVYRPSPKPRPMDPESFANENLYQMLEQIASSSWDSIYAVNSQPLRRSRPLPQPIIASEAKFRARVPTVNIELQASSVDHPSITSNRAKTLRRRFAGLGRWILRKAGDGLAGITPARTSGTRADG